MSLKYYIYISQSKVDMLLGQIPPAYKKKVATTLGVNLLVFNAKVEAGGEPKDSELYSHRLQLVSDYIQENEKIGYLEEPELWVKDELKVRHVTVPETPGIFLLIGKRGNRYHLLGGSSHNVIGNIRSSNADVNYSYFPAIVNQLKALFESDPSALFLVPRPGAVRTLGIAKQHHAIWGETHELSSVISSLYDGSTGPELDVEFLARMYGESNADDRYQCTLCSPLYVSLV